MKRTPLRKKRPGLRRGEPTAQEKRAAHDMAYNRAKGHCEADYYLHCCGGRYWPPTGGLRERGHLAHLRNRRMWGWGTENLAWFCPVAHSDLCHTKGLQVPRTYSELTEWQRSVATPKDGQE